MISVKQAQGRGIRARNQATIRIGGEQERAAVFGCFETSAPALRSFLEESTMKAKAITVSPVWAWAIIFAGKSIENRGWTTPHRGRLAIHAGLNRTTEADDRSFLAALGVAQPDVLPSGVILGMVDLIDCLPYGATFKDDPWACGPFCWILENPMPFAEPVPARGQQRLWECRLPKGLSLTTSTKENPR